jgi:hypothetical protein
MTLLTAVQNACAQLAIDVPAGVFSSTDTDIIQLRTLANVEVPEMVRKHDWQILRKQRQFTTVATEEQVGILPDDYLRMVNGTFQNRSLNRPVWGPLTPQAWQREKALPIYTSPNYAYVERNGKILFSPNPAGGDEVYFEYINKNSITSDTGIEKQYFTADTDVWSLDEKILELALVWRFKAAKGFDFSQEIEAYNSNVTSQISQEQPAATISMDGRSPRYMLGTPTIPEGSWTT